jgi:galactose mutarotase-like enzyme
VRGGIPVLFPYAGKLENEIFVPTGTKMKQHGFGRNKPWQISEKRDDLLRVSLAPDAETRAQYPYDFLAEQSAQVLPKGVQVELQIANTGTVPLPVSPGWHPYFVCIGAEKGRVRGDLKDVSSERFSNDVEFDFGVVAPTNGRASFEVPGLGKLRLSFSPEMRHLQFWSQPCKDFICIEPFRGPNNTVNTPKRIEIPAGEARTFWMRIEVDV